MNDDARRLQRLNQVHSVLSQINRAIVRSESPDGLYQETCRIAVESRLFQLAWIGLLDPEDERLKIIARHGADALQITRTRAMPPAATDAPGSATVWDVIRNDRHFICNDFAARTVDVQGSAEAEMHGLRGMACVPLHESGRVSGVLELYSAQSDLFDQDVVNLIEEMASDISFSLEHLQQEQARLAAETKVHYLAYYDPQTGLPNRMLLQKRLQELAIASNREQPLALLYIKLQRLDPIIRILGHSAADAMLRTLTQRLEGCRCGASLIAQLAQDEFALLLPGASDRNAICALAQEVQHTLSQALPAGSGEAFLSAGIGIAFYPADDVRILQLLPHAQIAAEKALRDGVLSFYQPELDRDSEWRLTVESELHRALERSEFELHYQPQLNLKTGVMVGVEALLRWRHPSKGLIGPAQFIPVLESCGLMPKVGEWALRTACRQNQSWQDSGLAPLRMAVNLSAMQFRQAGLVEVVRSALRDSGMAPEWLELELTESLILEDAERTIQMMHELKQLGVSLSLDDFGTGYSSLSYLRRFPVDRIKIDQSFVRDIATQADAAALARTILAMAHNLGLATIAEGVEEAGQLGYLRKHNCEEMQGFLFSRALPPDALAEWLREERKLPPANGELEACSTILALDDDPSVLAALKRQLRRDGITVLTASSAQEGFAILATTPVGVILSDQLIPGISGTEFLDQLKGLYPDSIRILLTGYANLSSVIDAINRGSLYKVLTKPWDNDQLRQNVREALHRYETTLENRRLERRLEQFRAKYPDENC